MSEIIPEEDNRNETSRAELAPAVQIASIAPLPATPPDLIPLETLDFLFVRQLVQRIKIVCDCKFITSYIVKKSEGSYRPLYHIREESGCCMRLCIGKNRCFNAIIDDYNGHPVYLQRCICCNLFLCCPPCLSTLSVTSSTGEVYGTIRQNLSIFTSRFTIENGQGKGLFKIKGPCWTYGCKCCGDIEFPIISKSSGEKIGMISKKWGGIIREAMTHADNFEISFPMDLDVRMKMVFLAAAILIDFLFFEGSPKRRVQNFYHGRTNVLASTVVV